MNAPDAYSLVDVPVTRAPERRALNSWGFALDVPPEHTDRFDSTFPWERGRGVATGTGELVAVHSSYPLTMCVPGGTAAVAGLTWVSVHPAHRRRGLLRAMIGDHFSRALARGETLSALYASEAPIYQRFGYGCAGWAARMDLGRAPTLRPVANGPAPTVHVEEANAATHVEVIRAVQRRLTRPGSIVGFPDALCAEDFADIPQWRDGFEAMRCAWVEDAEGPAAFALFARKLTWEPHGAAGEVAVRTWSAATPAALHALVSTVANLDLMARCVMERVPVDSPLVHLMADPRALAPRLADNLWVRILDLPGALTQRRYAHPVDVVIDVADATLPDNAGTWRFTVGQAGGAGATGTARVTRTDAAPDIGVNIQELSAAYLGGVSLTACAQAGLLTEHTPGSVEALARALAGTQTAVSTLAF